MNEASIKKAVKETIFDLKITGEKPSFKIHSKISRLLQWQSKPLAENTGNLFAKNPPLTQKKSPPLTKKDAITYLHWAIYTNLFPLSNVASIGFGVKTNGNTSKDIRFFVLPRLHFMLSKMTPLPFTNHFIESKHQLLQTAIHHYIHYFQDSKTNQALLSKAISLQKIYLQERNLLNDLFFSETSDFNPSLKEENQENQAEKDNQEKVKNETEENQKKKESDKKNDTK